MSKFTPGFALPLVIAIFPFLIFLGLIAAELAVNGMVLARNDSYDMHAQFAADAGADYALNILNSDNTWTGTPSPISVHNDSDITTEFSVAVSDIDDRYKSLIVTGISYRDGEEVSQRKIEVIARGVGGGSFSVITGVGGLFMKNSSKILGGNVFVNGEIEMSNTAQIGLASNSEPMAVRAAHQICGDDTDYPRVCNPGENGEPINIDNSAQIYADVYATNQTTGDNMSDSGLIPGQTVPPEPLPDHDRDAQKAAVAVTWTDKDQAACEKNQSVPKIWPANLKISIGEKLKLDKDCEIIVEGDVWIDNEIEMKNQVKLIVADTLGTTRPTIMIDGKHNDFENSSEMVANSQGTGFEVIGYYSKAACSPDCADVTGNDLKDSRNETNLHTKNSFTAPETLLYSRWARVSVDNSGGIGALIGQTVELKNSAAITFGVEASSDEAPSRWVVDSYKRVFD